MGFGENLLVKVGLNSSAVKTGLNSLTGQFNSFKGQLAGIGTAIFAAFSFQKAIDKAEEIGQVSRKFGISAVDAQRLGAAARKAGSDMETASRGGFKAFIEAQKAIAGDKAAREKFEQLHVTMEELKNLRGPADTILLLADAVKHAENQHVALAAAGDLVGTRQASLIQLFQMGREKIEAIGNAAPVMGNKTVEALEKSSKAMKRFQTQATVAAGTVLGFIQNATEKTAEFFGNLSAGSGGVGAPDDVTQAAKTVQALSEKAKRLMDAGRDDEAKRVLEQMDRAEARMKKLKNEKEGIRGDEVDTDAEEAAKQAAEEAAKLREQLAQQELSNARELMDAEQRRNSLIEERARLWKEAADAGWDSPDGLKKRVEAEKISGQLAKEEADRKKRREEEGEAWVKKRAERAETLAKKQRDLEFRSLPDDAAKMEFLEKEKEALQRKLAATGNAEEQFELQSKILDTQDAIENLRKPGKAGESFVADSMQRLGMGGNIGFIGKAEDASTRTAKAAEQSKTLLQHVDQSLKRIEGKMDDDRFGP